MSDHLSPAPGDPLARAIDAVHAFFKAVDDHPECHPAAEVGHIYVKGELILPRSASPDEEERLADATIGLFEAVELLDPAACPDEYLWHLTKVMDFARHAEELVRSGCASGFWQSDPSGVTTGLGPNLLRRPPLNASAFDAMTPLQRTIVERAPALAQELEAAADSAPHGQVIDRCESLLLGPGRESLRRALEDTLQAQVDALEKKGPPGGPAAVARPAATRGGRRGR
jgi:hypothetical protein